jgi:hypothetical protein
LIDDLVLDVYGRRDVGGEVAGGELTGGAYID